MDLKHLMCCCVLAAILFADVIVARPKRAANGDLEAMVRDIDERLIASQRAHSRRRRRNVMTGNIAIMEFCLQNPGQCRRELNKLRRERMEANGGRARPVVVIIDK